MYRCRVNFYEYRHCVRFYYPELSGITDSIILQGQALAARGHQVLYLVPRYTKKNYAHNKTTEIEFDFDPKVKVKRLPSISLPHSPTGQGRIVIPVGLAGEQSKNSDQMLSIPIHLTGRELKHGSRQSFIRYH